MESKADARENLNRQWETRPRGQGKSDEEMLLQLAYLSSVIIYSKTTENDGLGEVNKLVTGTRNMGVYEDALVDLYNEKLQLSPDSKEAADGAKKIKQQLKKGVEDGAKVQTATKRQMISILREAEQKPYADLEDQRTRITEEGRKIFFKKMQNK